MVFIDWIIDKSRRSFDIDISLIIFQILLDSCLRKNSKIFDVEYFAEGAINIVFCFYRRHFYDPSYNKYFSTQKVVLLIWKVIAQLHVFWFLDILLSIPFAKCISC